MQRTKHTQRCQEWTHTRMRVGGCGIESVPNLCSRKKSFPTRVKTNHTHGVGALNNLKRLFQSVLRRHQTHGLDACAVRCVWPGNNARWQDSCRLEEPIFLLHPCRTPNSSQTFDLGGATRFLARSGTLLQNRKQHEVSFRGRQSSPISRKNPEDLTHKPGAESTHPKSPPNSRRTALQICFEVGRKRRRPRIYSQH